MLYKIALFFHVTGALILCAAIVIEWLCISNIQKANTLARIKEALFTYSKLNMIGGISMILILVPGIYMMIAAWHDASWIMISFIGLILIGAIGGVVTGRKMSKIKKLIKNEDNNSSNIGNLLKNNVLWFSIKMRTAIFLGVIFLMTVKPGLAGSILSIAISIMLGALPLHLKSHPSLTDLNQVTGKES